MNAAKGQLNKKQVLPRKLRKLTIEPNLFFGTIEPNLTVSDLELNHKRLLKFSNLPSSMTYLHSNHVLQKHHNNRLLFFTEFAMFQIFKP